MCFCFSEQCIEAYELLLALAESEQSLILGQFRAAGVGSSTGKCGPGARPPSSFSSPASFAPRRPYFTAGIRTPPSNMKFACQVCFSFFPHDQVSKLLMLNAAELEWKQNYRPVKTNKPSQETYSPQPTVGPDRAGGPQLVMKETYFPTSSLCDAKC